MYHFATRIILSATCQLRKIKMAENCNVIRQIQSLFLNDELKKAVRYSGVSPVPPHSAAAFYLSGNLLIIVPLLHPPAIGQTEAIKRIIPNGYIIRAAVRDLQRANTVHSPIDFLYILQIEKSLKEENITCAAN